MALSGDNAQVKLLINRRKREIRGGFWVRLEQPGLSKSIRESRGISDRFVFEHDRFCALN
jgi:hypothetical protein